MMGLTCFDVIELLGELKSLKSRIAELESARRWIPVSERLPEREIHACLGYYYLG